MILSRYLIFFFLLFTLLPLGVSAADFVVVVNKGNPVDSLERSEANNIFLGKKTFWRKGQGINIILQADGDVHRSFVSEILHKSPQQLLMHWKYLLFSGTGIPPKKVSDDQSVKDAVAANPGAIGYIDARQFDMTVKEVKIK